MAQSNSLKLRAPIDSFIGQVFVADGPVQPNQQILTLTSPALVRLVARLQVYQQHIDLIQRPLIDGRIDQEIQTITQKQTFLNNAVDNGEQILADVQQDVAVGKKTTEDLLKAQLNLFSAQSALADATLAVEQADKKKQDLIDRIALAQTSLGIHATYVNALQAVMTIVAPVAGQFKLGAAGLSFVRKGDVVGEIEI